MKNIYVSIFLIAGLILAGCTKDNYDEPESFLSGQIVYNGTPLQLRGTGSAVSLQLYQHGYDYFNPISVYVGQDGAFSATMFNGDYLLVTRDGNGPWVNDRDSMRITIKGNMKIELNVTPYFMISNESVSMNGGQVSASCTISQIVPTANISNVTLLLNKTQFVDDINNIYRNDLSNPTPGTASWNINMSDNPEVTNAKALFGRICVRAVGADQGIYSPVIRLK